VKKIWSKVNSVSQVTPYNECPSRWRAIIIGALFSIPGFYFGVYGRQIVQALVWGGTSLQTGGVVVLFYAVTLTVAGGILSRRLRLKRSELLVIYTMTTITTAIGGPGMLAFVIFTLPARQYYATADNNWQSLFENLPRWLTVQDPVAVRGFYEADVTLYRLDILKAWATPLAFWLVFTTLLVLGSWMLCNLISQQWVNRERLSFPLIQVPLLMAQAGGRDSIWTNRLMWLGFAIPVVLQSFNYINYLHPSFPAIPLKARPIGQSITKLPWAAVKPVYVAFYPFMISVGFLLSVETSLIDKPPGHGSAVDSDRDSAAGGLAEYTPLWSK